MSERIGGWMAWVTLIFIYKLLFGGCRFSPRGENMFVLLVAVG